MDLTGDSDLKFTCTRAGPGSTGVAAGPSARRPPGPGGSHAAGVHRPLGPGRDRVLIVCNLKDIHV